MKSLPIKWKLMLIITGVSVVALLLACSVFVILELMASRENMQNELSILSVAVGYNSMVALAYDDHEEAEEVLRALRANPHIIDACTYTAEGEVFATYLRASHSGVSWPPVSFGNEYEFNKNRFTIFREIILDNGKKVGTLYIQADMGAERELLIRSIKIVGMVIVLCTVVSFLLSSKFQRLISDPIMDLFQTAQKISKDKDYSRRANKLGDDELGRLTDGFNEMIAQIQKQESEREKFVHAVQESEEKWRSLVENSPETIMTLDRDGKILFANRTVEDLKVEQLIGLSAYDFIPPDQHITLKNTLDKVLESGETDTCEIVGTSHRESTAWYDCHIGPIKQDGEVVALILIIQDVSERIRLEEELRQAQKMEAIGRLAGGVAHDFNNLLTIILGQCELVLMKLTDNDWLEKKMGAIRKSGHEAAMLTKQLLAFSRKQVLETKVLNLNSVINESSSIIRRLITESIQLDLITESGLENIEADLGQLKQIIFNLSINARDAMLQGGHLTIRTTNVYLEDGFARWNLSARYVKLEVSDTGTGIDKEHQELIFEPFFTTKKEGKGTGLGLSTVYGIVNQCKGHIEVSSEVGKGTTFTIYFPVVEKTAEDEAPPPQLPKDLSDGSETIIVVEDRIDLRLFAQEALETYRFKVLVASGGKEAIQISQQHQGKIHLILTDIVMPGLDGLALSKQLQSLRPEIKVLFMSGYSGDYDDETHNLTGGPAYLQKPFTPNELVQKVREVLDG